MIITIILILLAILLVILLGNNAERNGWVGLLVAAFVAILALSLIVPYVIGRNQATPRTKEYIISEMGENKYICAGLYSDDGTKYPCYWFNTTSPYGIEFHVVYEHSSSVIEEDRDNAIVVEKYNRADENLWLWYCSSSVKQYEFHIPKGGLLR